MDSSRCFGDPYLPFADARFVICRLVCITLLIAAPNLAWTRQCHGADAFTVDEATRIQADWNANRNAVHTASIKFRWLIVGPLWAKPADRATVRAAIANVKPSEADALAGLVTALATDAYPKHRDRNGKEVALIYADGKYHETVGNVEQSEDGASFIRAERLNRQITLAPSGRGPFINSLSSFLISTPKTFDTAVRNQRIAVEAIGDNQILFSSASTGNKIRLEFLVDRGTGDILEQRILEGADPKQVKSEKIRAAYQRLPCGQRFPTICYDASYVDGALRSLHARFVTSVEVNQETPASAVNTAYQSGDLIIDLRRGDEKDRRVFRSDNGDDVRMAEPRK